jgi:protease-4
MARTVLIRTSMVASLVAALLSCTSCIKPQITLFSEATEPLKEFSLQGSGKEKILMIPIKGFISDSNKDLCAIRGCW